jgi:ribosomal protein L37AE/L43A
MALIECPDCKREISDAAKACPHCGRPIADERRSAYTSAPARSAQLKPTLATPAVSPPREEGAGVWKCPQCGTVGAFRSFPELNAGGAPANSSLADIAQRVAPPARPQSPSTLPRVLGLLGGLLAAAATYLVTHSLWSALTVGVIISVGWVLLVGRAPSSEDYRQLTAAWQRKYLCTACGFVRESAV